MPDTLDRIAHLLLAHCEMAGKPLATLWTQNAFARLADLYDRWSWRTAYGQILLPDSYSTGTVTIDSTDPTLVTGTGTVWTAALVGMQLTVGSSFGYDIIEFIDSTHLRIALPWGDSYPTAAGYIIKQQYVLMPDDFQSFIAVIDPTRNYKVRHGIERREIDRRDPRRTTTGIPYIIAEAGYGRVYSGSVDPSPIAAKGTGPAPLFGGAYNGPANAVFTVEVTTGGASGVAVFKWKKDNGSPTGTYITGVLSDSLGVGLSDNVNVYWPAAVYVLGDIFVVRATAGATLSKPRYEVWPNQLTRTYLPYYYNTLPPDLSAPGTLLPPGIRSDVVLRGALIECRRWAGRGESNPNPLYDMKAAALEDAAWQKEVDILVLRDDDTYSKDVTYFHELPFGGPPWDSSFEQKHA